MSTQEAIGPSQETATPLDYGRQFGPGTTGEQVINKSIKWITGYYLLGPYNHIVC